MSVRRDTPKGLACLTACCRLILTALLFLHPSPTDAQEHPTARWYYEPQFGPPEHQVDMQHMRLEVSFIPDQGIVKGRVTHIFTPLRENVDSLFFDGPGIRILSATLNNAPVPWASTAEGVIVRFGAPLHWDAADSIAFVYEATPRRGLYFIVWNDPTGRSRKQIWTQGQGIDNRHWIPCYDQQNDKLTTETVVTFDSAYSVLSNGNLVDKRSNADGTSTWHYRMTHPHSVYLVMLGIGTYRVNQRFSQRGVPLHLWYYPDMPECVEPTYRYSAEAMDFLERETGTPFPWESYAQIPVQDFLYGAMENTTATVFGDFFLVDRRGFLDRNYVSVNVHELTHQWFGDYVTGRSGIQSWLHESFATFYAKLFLREILGEDAYQWQRRKEQDIALLASKKNLLPILHSASGSDRAYDKGSSVIDMMRYVFGDAAYRRVIRSYLQHHAYAGVETQDLSQAFQDVLGVSPSWFFEEWIYRGGEPHYAVAYEECTTHEGRRQTAITVRQTQETGDLVKLFTMPLVFEVHYRDGGTDRVRQTISRESENVVIPNPQKREIAFVLCDPGSWVTKELAFPKSYAELAAQVVQAPNMIDRYDALHALAATPAAAKRALLIRVFDRERFPSMRAEVIAQLGSDTVRECRSLLVKALADPDPEVRAAALKSCEVIPVSLQQPFERLVRDSSYNLAAEAIIRLSARFPERRTAYLSWVANDRGVGNRLQVLRHTLQAEAGNRASLDTLVDMAGPSWEFRTRVNALEALQSLNHLDSLMVLNLCDAVTHWNNRLRGPATDVVLYLLRQHAHRELFTAVLQQHPWAPWQREMIDKILATP